MKVVREHYVRDDIPCASALCAVCDNTTEHTPVCLCASPYGNRYLVIDTNVALHQMDLLESKCDALCDVIVCQTVMEEVKHRNLAIYRRLHSLLSDHSRRFVLFANEHHRGTYAHPKLGESPNDRNDRAIRRVASWCDAIRCVCVLLLLCCAGRVSKSLRLFHHHTLTRTRAHDSLLLPGTSSI